MDDSFTIVHNLLRFFPLVFDDVEGVLEVSVEAPEKLKITCQSSLWWFSKSHFKNITLIVFNTFNPKVGK